MRFNEECLTKSVSSLYSMRDEVSLEMIEAKGKKLSTLKDKLETIEEAIMLKESGYESQEINQEA